MRTWYQDALIPKESLQIGTTYRGTGVPSSYGKWDGVYFEYPTRKYSGLYYEKMAYPTDNTIYPIFYPTEEM